MMQNDGDIKKTDSELIFDPYNNLNTEVSLKFLSDILKKYGVPDTVHNINLYKRAFVHKSYCKRPKLDNEVNNITIVEKPGNCIPLKTKSNERLEFLGDGVLECVTKYYLYRRFPKENEGFMTEKKIALVKNETIGRMAYEMGLNRHYILSKNAEEKKTRTNLKKLGCLFEAFLGALFLDFNKISIHDDEKWFDNVFVTGPGFQIAQIFIENVFEKHINWLELVNNNDNYKNQLQVQLQQAFKVTPIYKEINVWDEEEGYHMGVYLAVNHKSHQFIHSDNSVMGLKEFFNMNQIEKTDNTIIERLKDYYNSLLDNELEPNFIIFLSESKHKIKKKAEQAACKMAYETIIAK
jgi:dsRNA-specific ribonuclease